MSEGHHDIQHRLEMDHDEILEELRDYDETGNWRYYLHVEKEDWWWDTGAYVHIGFLTFWCLWCLLVDGFITRNQMYLNHLITYAWIVSSALYAYGAIIKDFAGGKGTGG